MSRCRHERRSATCGAMWRSGLGRTWSNLATAPGKPMSWHKLSTLGFLLAFNLHSAGLSESVQAGDHAAVEKLIQQHADVNATNAEGMTPLDLAARADDVKMTALLLKAGASAKASTRDGITPLWLAVMNRDAEMTNALLKAGADANAALPGGETIL